MRIIELTIAQFDSFASNHPLSNYAQSSFYAKLMGEKGFNFDFIGYQDDSNNIIGASLILTKRLGGFFKYAYAPKGFLIDYYNEDLLSRFIKDICSFYSKKGMAFIKINPEIIIGELNIKKNYSPNYNQNVKIIDDLKTLGFKRRREIIPLDFIFPRISPYINLGKFDLNKLDLSVRDTIHQSINSGLSLEEVSSKDIFIFYEFIKNNTYENINFYRSLLNTFTGNSSELLLVKVDYEACLINARTQYDLELEHNNACNEKIQIDNNEENLNEKMQSDKDLLILKNAIVEATEGLKQNKHRYVAGAIVVKYHNRISIIAEGIDKSFTNFNPIYFLYFSLIERFKKDYDFLDLNGLASNFSSESKYFDYNENKLLMNPDIYEFIGEFDIIINELTFKRIQAKGLMSNEFNPSYKL